MCRIRFEPWIGSRYDLCLPPRPPIFGESRVLILGESHYTDRGEDHEDHEDQYTRDFTSNIVRTRRADLQFFLNLKAACVVPVDAMTSREFWHSVAFYNYVQWFVPGPGQETPPEMFRESRDAFRECLNCLRPTHVIACGFGLWDRLCEHQGFWCANPDVNQGILPFVPEQFQYKELWAGNYHYEGGTCLIVAIRHPAAYFQPLAWHDMLQAFFAFQPPQH